MAAVSAVSERAFVDGKRHREVGVRRVVTPAAPSFLVGSLSFLYPLPQLPLPTTPLQLWFSPCLHKCSAKGPRWLPRSWLPICSGQDAAYMIESFFYRQRNAHSRIADRNARPSRRGRRPASRRTSQWPGTSSMALLFMATSGQLLSSPSSLCSGRRPTIHSSSLQAFTGRCCRQRAHSVLRLRRQPTRGSH